MNEHARAEQLNHQRPYHSVLQPYVGRPHISYSLSVLGTTTYGRVIMRMHPIVLITVSKRTEELN
jgi:hypothetical protein